jgi:hypothetical protein
MGNERPGTAMKHITNLFLNRRFAGKVFADRCRSLGILVDRFPLAIVADR